MHQKTWKVEYVAGSGITLASQLSDGQTDFKAGIVYDVPTYDDFNRLTQNGDFAEVKEAEVREILAAIPEPEEDKEDKPKNKSEKTDTKETK